MLHHFNRKLLAAVCAIAWASAVGAETAVPEMNKIELPDPEEVEIQVIPLADNLYMLMGIGGNIAVSSGPDGVFIVDGDVRPMFPKLRAAIATLSPEPIQVVFNTHWHFDHTGGNQSFHEEGALVVAHDNVRARMSTPQYSRLFNIKTQPSPAEALPLITFDNTATFHFNGQTLRAIHTAPAHTDGDAIVIFEEANVAHLGDVFFNGMYPLIDIEAGGSMQGIIDSVESILPLLDENTQIIPGHGPLATLEDLLAYQSMLKLVTARIGLLIGEGKTKEDVVALHPTVNFDADWQWDLLPADIWVGLVYDSLAEQAPQATE